MFWDNVACVYDIFAYFINKKANKELCLNIKKLISKEDNVLECACGTGLLTNVIAQSCNELVATDFSKKMLKKAKKKCSKYPNVQFFFADILNLNYENNYFDVVVAANVIHLLDNPFQGLCELERVCKKGGKIIIPTYINKKQNGKNDVFSKTLGKAGVDFKHEFTFNSYKEFFLKAGYKNVEYILCQGKIPCLIAIIKKEKIYD